MSNSINKQATRVQELLDIANDAIEKGLRKPMDTFHIVRGRRVQDDGYQRQRNGCLAWFRQNKLTPTGE
tara:strand:+ start:532 stop:738 length:207 start_codon:yes stop_codon:yes gene_type:complete